MLAARESAQRGARDVVGNGYDRNGDALIEAETAGRNGRPVQDDRSGPRPRGVLDGRGRIVACANEHGTTGDDAFPRAEKGPQRRRRLEAIRART
jgi:hypothetical protein